jgi:hypothetical protein
MLLVLANGCTSKSRTIPSPDGSMEIVTSVEQSRADPTAYPCVIFEIRDKQGRVLYKQNTHASDRMRWNMDWVLTNRIRLVSSDIGTRLWEQETNGNWELILNDSNKQ